MILVVNSDIYCYMILSLTGEYWFVRESVPSVARLLHGELHFYENQKLCIAVYSRVEPFGNGE